MEGKEKVDFIGMLERDGWKRVAIRDGHWQFKHREKKGRITLPGLDGEIALSGVASIHRQAGWCPPEDHRCAS